MQDRVRGEAGRRIDIAAPEPGLTPETLIARAVALRPRIRAEQDESDARGHYSDALHQAFRAAGFYRIAQPQMFGGYEMDLVTFYKVMVEIARGQPGVGWCLTLAASHAFLLASHWPEQAQREIFAPTGEFAAPHRAMPSGTATPVAGGYRIDGQWNYCSGIPHSTHFIGTAMRPVAGGPAEAVLFVVPKGSYEILDDWGGDAVLGMQASGSNSVKVSGVVVPEHHVVKFNALFARPEDMADGTPGTRLHGNPMYLGRLMGPYHASLVSTVVGAAWAALDEYEHYMTTMKTYVDPNVMRRDHVDFQRPFGQALALTDAAEAVLLAGVQKYMDLCARWQKDGTPIGVEDNLRLWTMIQQGGRLACDAVELLFHTGGSFTTRKGNRLQRYFRDVAVYRTHISAQHVNFATMIGRAHLGLEVGFRGL